MKNCVDEAILKTHNVDSRFGATGKTATKVNLIGYCMGGTMSTIFSARYPHLVNTVTFMAAPLDFSVGQDESLVQLWADPNYFDVDALIDAFGNCPGPCCSTVSPMMKPVKTTTVKYTTLRQARRRELRRELLRDGEMGQRQHPGRGRNVPRIREVLLSSGINSSRESIGWRSTSRRST